MWEQDARWKIMIPFKNAGWAWYNHFQDIWLSVRARGAHAFVGGHDAAPATTVNLLSTPTSAPALLSTIIPSDAEMDETDPTMSVLSAKCKNEASDFKHLHISGRDYHGCIISRWTSTDYINLRICTDMDVRSQISTDMWMSLIRYLLPRLSKWWYTQIGSTYKFRKGFLKLHVQVVTRMFRGLSVAYCDITVPLWHPKSFHLIAFPFWYCQSAIPG